MADTPPDDFRTTERRLDAIQCPHCDEVTMPNLLVDGSAVCSCTAERALPLDLLEGTPWDGEEGTMPPPVDDRSVGDGSVSAHRMPDGTEDSQPQEGRKDLVKPPPGDHGQFGRDVATEDYRGLNEGPKE